MTSEAISISSCDRSTSDLRQQTDSRLSWQVLVQCARLPNSLSWSHTGFVFSISQRRSHIVLHSGGVVYVFFFFPSFYLKDVPKVIHHRTGRCSLCVYCLPICQTVCTGLQYQSLCLSRPVSAPNKTEYIDNSLPPADKRGTWEDDNWKCLLWVKHWKRQREDAAAWSQTDPQYLMQSCKFWRFGVVVLSGKEGFKHLCLKDASQ